MVKYTKTQAFYTSTGPPPLLYIYQCQYCKFFLSPGDCQIVCRAGYPDNNIISASGWCALWYPLPDDPVLSWIPRTFGVSQECVVNG